MGACVTDLCRILLLAIGISGFLLQFLLTEGLQREKGGRAANLIVSFQSLAIVMYGADQCD